MLLDDVKNTPLDIIVEYYRLRIASLGSSEVSDKQRLAELKEEQRLLLVDEDFSGLLDLYHCQLREIGHKRPRKDTVAHYFKVEEMGRLNHFIAILRHLLRLLSATEKIDVLRLDRR